MNLKWQRLIKAGLCVNYERCRNARGQEGTSTECRPCASERSRTQSQKNAEARLKRRQHSQCTECPDKAEHGRKTCRQHGIESAVRSKNYRARQRRRLRV